MTCPVCRTTTVPEARFCHACGAEIRPQLGGEAGDGGAEAGASRLAARAIGASVPGGEAADGGAEAELDRRVVTVLVADLVGYSGLVAAHDPEDVRRRMDALFSRLAACVDRFGGSVEKFVGDAIFAVFGIPGSHDDDALRAVVCARAMRDVARGTRLLEASDGRSEDREAGARDPVDDRDWLELRIGLSTGEVVAGPRRLAGRADWTITGLPAALAARIAERARPGEVLVDPETALAARHRIDVEVTDRAVVVPGRSPLRLLRVVGLRSPFGMATIGPALIGRWRERERLRAALDAVARTGRGRVVLVVGEAGIGKSRLLADLEADARAAGFRWTWTENVSYRAAEPYASARNFVEAVAAELGLDAGTAARQLVLGGDLETPLGRRYAGAIAVLAREAGIDGWEAELALAPVDPVAVATSLLEVGTRFVRRLAETTGRRVVVLDDLHWADPSSRPITDHLIATCPDLPFLVLATIRPGRLPAWADLSHVEVVDLGGLDVSETERLVEALVGVDLSSADAARLWERTGGNPLFIVETIRSLLDEGAARVEDGRLVVDPVRLTGGVPLTLRAMVGARLDALDPEDRAVLEVASVVGMSFDVETVGALLGRPVGEGELLRLGRAGFLTPVLSAGRWRFTHPLVHEATHRRMVASRRVALHTRLADHLEASEPPPPASQLAFHRAIARDPRAVPLLARAADEAIAAGAMVEAAGFFRTAAELAADPVSAERFRHLASLALGRGGLTGREPVSGATS